VSVITSEAAKSAAFFEPDRDGRITGEIDDFLYSRAAGAARDHDSIQRATGF
jgi:hypothetical protein